MNYIQFMSPGGNFNITPQTGETKTDQDGNTVVWTGDFWAKPGEPAKEGLQPHDYFTIASIAGDLAALGLSFTGLTPAAAATGAAATTSALIADIKRDGFQFRDLGWAALGYGLDAISLLPVAGAAAQIAKATPKLAKVAPIILGLGTATLSGLGIGTSIPAFKKVVNGEKLTADDYRLMTNALLAVVGLGRQTTGLAKGIDLKKETPTSVPAGKTETQAEYIARLKSQTQERMAHLEAERNERHRQIQSSDQNWGFKLAQMASNVQMKDRGIEQALGTPKTWRNAVVKKSPIGIAEPSPMLDHILLINRVGGEGSILWQNGQLVWPKHKELIEGVDNSHFTHERSTVHFTTHKPVTDHLEGKWSQGSTTIMVPITAVMRSNGNPMSISPMDTYWNNSVSMQVPASQVRVFTGSLQEATKARMQGAQVIFSKKAHELSKNITRLLARWDEIVTRYNYDMDKVWGDTEAVQVHKNIEKLREENYKLHKAFTDEQQKAHPLTEEDYKMLEAATGLKAGVETAWNGKLSYHSTPTQHSNEWWNYGFEFGQGVKYNIDNYVFDLKRAVAPDGWDDVRYMDDIISWIKNERLSPEHLLILQQSVQRSKPEDLRELQRVAELVPDDWPNANILKNIANGVKVYKWKSGGSIHIKKKNKGKIYCLSKSCRRRGSRTCT